MTSRRNGGDFFFFCKGHLCINNIHRPYKIINMEKSAHYVFFEF